MKKNRDCWFQEAGVQVALLLQEADGVLKNIQDLSEKCDILLSTTCIVQ
jgi:hypothetical protein